MVDICLDREDGYWCEGVLKTEQNLPEGQFPAMAGRVLTRAKQEHADRLGALREVMEALGVDNLYKHDTTKKPVSLPEAPNDDQPLATPSHNTHLNKKTEPQPNSQGNESISQQTRPPSVSVRTSRAQSNQAEHVGRTFDWSKAPKPNELLAQIERDMQQKEDGHE